MDLSSVYVSVEEMDRALEFYRELFDAEPAQAEERFSTFAFDGVNFGLYDPGYDGYDVDFGDNCVPNFEIEEVEAAHERIGALAPEVDDEIQAFGDYHTFHCRDTEGNTLEIFSVESG